MKRPSRPRSFRRRAAASLLWFLQEFTYRGRMVVVAGVLLASLAFAGMLAWRHWSTSIEDHDDYMVTASRIILSPPPTWLEKPHLAAEALEEAGLAGSLSVLDADLIPRVVEALELHPWVERVKRAEKRYPASLDVEVEYRLPVAAVEAGRELPTRLCPVDIDGVRLPEIDVPAPMLMRLPRIKNADQPPVVGQSFAGPQMLGALVLVKFLQDQWDSLHLHRIVPSDRPEIRGEEKYMLYDIVSTGGTTIHWGAAPKLAPPDEAPPEVKLRRLQDYVHAHGPLDTIASPSVIDIRRTLKVTPRVAEVREAAVE